MKKFLIIGYKYCPNFSRFKLICDFYDITYENIEVHDFLSLKEITHKLFNNYLKEFLLLDFKGSVIIYEDKIMENAGSLILEIYLLKKLKITNKIVDIISKEQWIDNHMNEFYWLSVGNNITDLFKKSFLTSERNQLGNKILLDKLTMLNYWFNYNQWVYEEFSISDFSLLFFIKGVVEKNSNILNNFYHLNQWYLRMIVKKNPLFFLKNQ